MSIAPQVTTLFKKNSGCRFPLSPRRCFEKSSINISRLLANNSTRFNFTGVSEPSLPWAISSDTPLCPHLYRHPSPCRGRPAAAGGVSAADVARLGAASSARPIPAGDAAPARRAPAAVDTAAGEAPAGVACAPRPVPAPSSSPAAAVRARRTPAGVGDPAEPAPRRAAAPDRPPPDAADVPEPPAPDAGEAPARTDGTAAPAAHASAVLAIRT